MKKRTLLPTLLFVFVMLITFNVNAQDFPDLDKSSMDAATYPGSYKISNKQIKVIYSRPLLKGRTVSKLAPNDEVWRTGANEAAEITLYTSFKIGDKKVKVGTYSLFTIPGEKEWTVILNSDINVWGAYTYNPKNDVARIKVPVKSAKLPLEAFSIVFEESKTGAIMHLGWGEVVISVPFENN